MAKQKNLSCSWKIGTKGGAVRVVVMALMLMALFSSQNGSAADLMHNSKDTGSTKWPGGWGVAGGRYGKFTCSTCHEPNARNIKNVRKTISVMNNTSTTHTLPNGQLSADVTFRNVTSMGGDDRVTHSSSSRICEVCHSQTLYHNADSSRTLPVNRTHPTPKAVCTSCHSHNTGFKAACGGCHGNPPTSVTLGGYSGLVGTPRASNALPAGNAGAHRKHAQQSLVCNTCHYISDGSTRMPSLSNSIQLGFYGFGGTVTSGTYVAYSGANRGYPITSSTPNTTMAPIVTTYANANKCNNLYCHGGGVVTGGNLRAPLTGGTNSAPQWTGTGQSACGTCHGADADSPPTTGSHTTHAKSLASGNYAISCIKCHPAYASGTHVQGNLAWDLDTADTKIGGAATYRGEASGFTGQLAPSSTFGQCANINCHSDGRGNPGIVATPTWGDTSGFAGCVGCHGGSATSTYPLVQNAHKAHVRNESAAYNGVAFSCVECHNSVVSSDTTIVDRTLHVNGVKNVSWGPKSTGGQAYSGTCANIYCHSNGQGVYKTPAQTWVGVTTDGQEGTAPCDYCHGGIAGNTTPVSSMRHTNHIGSGPLPHKPIQCSWCHSNTVRADGQSIYGGVGTTHINRAINVSFAKLANFSGSYNDSTNICSNTWCHTNNPYSSTRDWDNGTTNTCGNCHAANNTTTSTDKLSDAHRKHYNTSTRPSNTTEQGWTNVNLSVSANVFMCGVCHPGNPTSSHLNGPAELNGSAAEVALRLPFIPPAGKTRSETVNRGTSPILLDGRGYQYSSGTTCDTYCHSDGRGGPPKTVMTWSISTTSCGNCHNKAGDTGTTFSGAHDGHLNSIISTVTCNSCHAGTASGNNTLIANRRDRHPNGFVNVTGNSVAGPLSFNGDTCSNVYCHPTQSPSWVGGVLDGGCASCHGSNAASVTPIDSKGHRAHVHNDLGKFKDFNFKCYECHFSTVDSTDQAISTKANHINGSPTVAWGPRADGAGTVTYNPTVKCTTYCHSNGSGKFKAPPKTWNSMSAADEDTIRCDYCHGGIVGYGNLSTINTGRHTNHLFSTPKTSTVPHRPTTCNECHSQTVAADGMSIYNGSDVKHINKQVDITFMKMGNFSGAWTKATSTCNNTWCHGSRARTWSSATLACGGCHEASNRAAFGLSSSHRKHYNTSTRASATTGWTNTNASTSSANIYRCGMCHPGGNGAGQIEEHHLNGPAAANGSAAEIVLWLPFTVPAGADRPNTVTRGTDGLRVDSAGYMFSQGTTCDTYCHSDGKGNPPKMVMRWSKTVSSCGNCHNKAGDDPTGTTWSKPHDMHATEYGNGGTIGSYNTTTNNTFVTCAACHASTTSSNTALVSRARHPNGFRNISASTKVGSAAFDWDPVNNQCKNGYCHSKAYSFTDYSTSWIKWDQSQAQIHCGSCHTSYPTGPDYANGYKGKANSHPKHAVFWGFTCNWCHSQTAVFRNNSTVISTVRNHVNKNYNVVADGTQTFIGKTNTFTAVASTNPPITRTTCRNVNCHGGNTSKVFTWGGRNKCGDCHFATSDTANYAFKNSTMAVISRTEWSYSGHGKQSGIYDVTGSTFAGFSTAARVAGADGDPCLYCHDYDAIPHGTVTNPMRLRNFSDPVYGKNGVCLSCHATGAQGVEPFAAYSTKSARKRVDKFHYGTQHSADLNSGQFCWDCHDAHGDRTSTNSGPIAMVKRRPAVTSDPTTGIPLTTATQDVSFTAKSAASNFGKTSAPFNGICNVCHTAKADDPNKMVHYTATGSDGTHNTSTLCTDCHKHSDGTVYNGEAYKASTYCNSCHDYDTRDGGGTWGKGTQFTAGGWGAHAVHINYIKNRWNQSLTPTTDQFGIGAAAAVCGVCHTNQAASHTTGNAAGGRQISWGDDLLYPRKFGSSNPIFNTGARTCSNIDCHYMTSPVWQ